MNRMRNYQLLFLLLVLGIASADLYDFDHVILGEQSFPEIPQAAAEYCALHRPLESAADEEYIEARVGYNNAVNEDTFPLQILYPTTVEEVSKALSNSLDLHGESAQVCVRACGNSFAGLSSACHNGTIIDLSELSVSGELSDMVYDKETKRVTIGSAMKQEDVFIFLNSRGRSLPLGAWLGTCVSGFTLGGGFSDVSRANGLACDHLEEVTILLPGHNDPVRATKYNMYKDIFWASCGGGGGIGIVLSMTFQTYEEHHIVIWDDIITLSEIKPVLDWWNDEDSNYLHDIDQEKTGLSIEFDSFKNTEVGMEVARMKLIYPTGDTLNIKKTEANFKSLLLSFWPWKTKLEVISNSYSQYALRDLYNEGQKSKRCGFWGRHKSQFYEQITMDDVKTISSHLSSKWDVLPNLENIASRKVGINAWGGAISRDSNRDNAFWGRDAGFEVKYEVDYNPLWPYDLFKDSLCTNQENENLWDAVCESWVYFNIERWAEGWLHSTSSKLCYDSRDPLCKYSFINHVSEFGNNPKAYFGDHLARLTKIKNKYDGGNSLFASWQLEEKGENRLSIRNPDRPEHVKTFNNFPPKVLGYLPLYDSLPDQSLLDEFDVIFLFAATTLVRKQELDGWKFSCSETCDLGFPDASEEIFKQYANDVSQVANSDILLTVGGAAMNGCWEYCYEKVDKLAHKIAGYVHDNGLDGVDFNIEDPPSMELFSFIKDLVIKTQNALDAKDSGKQWVMSHSPLSQYLDRALDSSDPGRFHALSYNWVLQELHDAGYLSFLFVQYYNSWPVASVSSKNQFYESFVGHVNRMQDIYGFKKVMIGMCTGGCQRPSIVENNQVESILRYLQRPFDNNIGAAGVGFWKITAPDTVDVVRTFSDKIDAFTYKGYLNEKYPECDVENSDLIGDGYCDTGAYDSEFCGWDGEDCPTPSLAPSSFPTIQYSDCIVKDSPKLGNGVCDAGRYNTEMCGWDDGDCKTFNAHFPDCDIELPSKIGDGNCDEDYNTLACFWDGNDCHKPSTHKIQEDTEPSLISVPTTSAGFSAHDVRRTPKLLILLLISSAILF